MAEHPTDESIQSRIERLVREEQELYRRADLDDHAQVRLEALKVELDRYWDLLRQREALREFGKDPDAAKIRPASVVEKYEQ